MKFLSSASFLSAIDLNKNELRNVRLQNLAVAPSSPVAGQLYFDTVGNVPKVWDGTAWITVTDAWIANVTADGPITVGITNKVANISIPAASSIADGYMTSGDKSKLDDAASANTASTLVIRDASGNFSAATITANKVTGLAAPVNDSDAATKSYVDAARSGLDVKGSVRAATTTAIADLSGDSQAGTSYSIDGITLVTGDRVLVKNTASPDGVAAASSVHNGLYTVSLTTTGASGSETTTAVYTRTTDADEDAEVTPGMFTFVEEGTTNANSGWVLTTNGTIVVGTTGLDFVQFSGAGQIDAGAGLTKSGNTLDVGAGTGITVNANTVQISTTYAGQTSINTVGTITNGTWNATPITLTYIDSTGGAAGTVAMADGAGNTSWQEIPSGENVQREVTLTAHGFVVGDVLRHNGTTYVKAMADTVAGAEVIGIVAEVIDANTFMMLYQGYIVGLTGLTAGEVYFVSPTVAGAVTATEPPISKPVLIAESATSGYFHNFRGTEDAYETHTHAISDITGLQAELNERPTTTRILVGDGTNKIYNLTHTYNDAYPLIQIYEASTGEQVLTDVAHVSATQVKVSFSMIPALNEYYAILHLKE